VTHPGSHHPGTGVHVSRPYRAAGRQRLGCGCMVDVGDPVYELHGPTINAIMCRPCLDRIGHEVAHLDDDVGVW
jgi:hypothetical protein